MTTRKPTPTKKRSNILEKYAKELSSVSNSGGYVFSEALKADIDKLDEARLAGKLHCSMSKIAMILKKEHSIPLAIDTITRRIKEHVGREKW